MSHYDDFFLGRLGHRAPTSKSTIWYKLGFLLSSIMEHGGELNWFNHIHKGEIHSPAQAFFAQREQILSWRDGDDQPQIESFLNTISEREFWDFNYAFVAALLNPNLTWYSYESQRAIDELDAAHKGFALARAIFQDVAELNLFHSTSIPKNLDLETETANSIPKNVDLETETTKEPMTTPASTSALMSAITEGAKDGGATGAAQTITELLLASGPAQRLPLFVRSPFGLAVCQYVFPILLWGFAKFAPETLGDLAPKIESVALRAVRGTTVIFVSDLIRELREELKMIAAMA